MIELPIDPDTLTPELQQALLKNPNVWKHPGKRKREVGPRVYKSFDGSQYTENLESDGDEARLVNETQKKIKGVLSPNDFRVSGTGDFFGSGDVCNRVLSRGLHDILMVLLQCRVLPLVTPFQNPPQFGGTLAVFSDSRDLSAVRLASQEIHKLEAELGYMLAISDRGNPRYVFSVRLFLPLSRRRYGIPIVIFADTRARKLMYLNTFKNEELEAFIHSYIIPLFRDCLSKKLGVAFPVHAAMYPDAALYRGTSLLQTVETCEFWTPLFYFVWAVSGEMDTVTKTFTAKEKSVFSLQELNRRFNAALFKQLVSCFSRLEPRILEHIERKEPVRISVAGMTKLAYALHTCPLDPLTRVFVSVGRMFNISW